MPYVTSVERSGIKKGRQQGGQDALLVVLECRFQSVPPDIQEQVRAFHAPEVLTNLARQAATVDSMDAFVQALAVATQTDSLS